VNIKTSNLVCVPEVGVGNHVWPIELPMTLSEVKGHLCCFNFCNIFNLGNHTACDLNRLSKVKDLPRSQAVMYTEKMIISQKHCSTEML